MKDRGIYDPVPIRIQNQLLHSPHDPSGYGLKETRTNLNRLITGCNCTSLVLHESIPHLLILDINNTFVESQKNTLYNQVELNTDSIGPTTHSSHKAGKSTIKIKANIESDHCCGFCPQNDMRHSKYDAQSDMLALLAWMQRESNYST